MAVKLSMFKELLATSSIGKFQHPQNQFCGHRTSTHRISLPHPVTIRVFCRSAQRGGCMGACSQLPRSSTAMMMNTRSRKGQTD